MLGVHTQAYWVHKQFSKNTDEKQRVDVLSIQDSNFGMNEVVCSRIDEPMYLIDGKAMLSRKNKDGNTNRSTYTPTKKRVKSSFYKSNSGSGMQAERTLEDIGRQMRNVRPHLRHLRLEL